jgi:(p)ppGpp synthase/HD superfamily hydrolase
MENRAMEYAIKWHQISGQTYDGSPYTKHLEMVVTVAQKYLYYLDCHEREDALAACWCHDLIEDTTVTKNHLSEFLNDRIAEIVFSVTNEHAKSRIERNLKTFSKIGSDNLAIFVKLCDRIANTSNSKVFATKIYSKYINEFPLFQHCLRYKQRAYQDMWRELENLYH